MADQLTCHVCRGIARDRRLGAWLMLPTVILLALLCAQVFGGYRSGVPTAALFAVYWGAAVYAAKLLNAGAGVSND